MFNDFEIRGYTDFLLTEIFDKLCMIKRDLLLKPKSNLVTSHLKSNNPEILDEYMYVDCETNINNDQTTFIAFPYYKMLAERSSFPGV